MKEENKRLIKILIVIIVAIICVIAVVTLVLFKDDPSRFYGHWKVNILGIESSPGYWSFYENGSMKAMSYGVASDEGNIPNIEFEKDADNKNIIVTDSGITTEWGSYEIKGNKLYLSGISDFSGSIGINYNFINNNKLEINIMIFTLNLTKIEESEIIINPEFEQIPWENVNISISAYNEEHYNWINLTRSSISYYDEHAPSEWEIVQNGDIIEIGDYDEYVTIKFTWIPNDTSLGFFSFYER